MKNKLITILITPINFIMWYFLKIIKSKYVDTYFFDKE